MIVAIVSLGGSENRPLTRPFPPFDNKGRELAGIKQILH